MREDDVLTDRERDLSRVLRPGDERVRLLILRVLSAERRTDASRRHRLLAAGTVALLIVGALLWRASPDAPPALHISGSGSVLVVTSDDGRRWVVDAQRDQQVRGQYVIAVPK